MIDRVYVNAAARRELGWTPRHDLDAGEDWASPLTHKVGVKGYHADSHGIDTVR